MALAAAAPPAAAAAAHTEAAAAIGRALAVVTAVGERYRAQGDLLSLALLYESAQSALDYPQAVGRGDAEMGRVVREAAEAFGALETNQAARVGGVAWGVWGGCV
jgi:hypothetical protein